MVEWRQRGYVQDSDEEDISSIEDGLSASPTRIGAAATALQIERTKTEIQTPRVADHASLSGVAGRPDPSSGYETDAYHYVDELQLKHRSANGSPTSRPLPIPIETLTPELAIQNTEAANISDLASSPLTEVDNISQIYGNSEERRLPVSSPTFGSPPYVVVPQDFSHHSSVSPTNETQHNAKANGRKRTFRQRNPIQLHPYLLENEHYRQTLRSRGLRPIHVEDEDCQSGIVPRLSNDEGTQYSSQMSEFRPSAVAQSPRPRTRRQISPEASIDDESSDRILNGSKKRKLRRSLDQIAPLAHWSPSENALEYDKQLFDLSSSPNSEDQAVGQVIWRPKMKRFRLPHGRMDTQLPTPSPSSDLNEAENLVRPLESHSQINRSLTPATAHMRSRMNSKKRIIRTSSISSEDRPSLNDDFALRANVKRIKGVLPASWLRLDQQAQRIKPPKQRQSAQSTQLWARTVHQRGIAQRTNQHHSSQTFTYEDKSSIKSSEHERPNHAVVPKDRNLPICGEIIDAISHLYDSQASDLEESDRVDAMLPSTEGIRNRGSRGKRQIRLADAFQRGMDRVPISTMTYPRSTGAMSGSVQHPMAQKVELSAPLLSIVDAVGSRPTKSFPDFVRVAVRQVRKRDDKGRHSPSRKHISMHKRSDTTRAMQSLDRWKERRGAMQPRAMYRSRSGPRTRARSIEHNYKQQTRFTSPTKSTVSQDRLKLNCLFPAALNGDMMCESNQSKKHTNSLLVIPMHTSSTKAIDSSRDQAIASSSSHQNRFMLLSSLLDRPGQLEGFEEEYTHQNRWTAFQQSLTSLDSQQASDLLLDKFLSPKLPQKCLHDVHRPSTGDRRMQSELTPKKLLRANQSSISQRRKPRPRQALALDQDMKRLEFEDSFPDGNISNSSKSCFPVRLANLTAMDGSEAVYTTTYGVEHLPNGSSFTGSSLIGKGLLLDALNMSGHSFDQHSEATVFDCNGVTRVWGSWTDEVAAEFDETFASLLEVHARELTPLDEVPSEASVLSSLRVMHAVLSYFSNILNFHDPADRNRCAARMNATLSHAFETGVFQRNAVQTSSGSDKISRQGMGFLTFFNVLAFQALQLGSHAIVEEGHRRNAETTFRRAARHVANFITDSGISEPQQLLQNFRRTPSDPNVDHKSSVVEATVVLNHLLGTSNVPGLSFWGLMNERFCSQMPRAFTDVSAFEQSWQQVFTLLPLLEINSQGLVRYGRSESAESWCFVKMLLARIFELYHHPETFNAPSMNAYIRAILSRCFILVKIWNWTNSEMILGCIFDFFAKRRFSYLQNEGSRTSPAFLGRLDQTSPDEIIIDQSDLSFDIVLKMLSVSLFRWSAEYSQRKLKNLIWRFIPNHGRRHAKEDDLVEEHLGALRNQHNLLCVLYWASPAKSRIDLSHLRNLVDVRQSHFEVCRLNIRSWEILTRYQISTLEGVSAIGPLALWYNTFILDLMALHGQARAEAETNFMAAKPHRAHITRDMLEHVITKNERQVEGLLTMILVSYASLMENATNNTSATCLFEHTDLARILGLLDSQKPRLNTQVTLALGLYQTYFTRVSPGTNVSLQQDSEDSQDYGEWAGLEEVAESGAKTQFERTLSIPGIDKACGEVQTVLSNAFGSDNFLDESLLSKMVDCWISSCRTAVARNGRTWSYFIDRHSSGSWYQLRDTPQTRQFTPYFFAVTILSERAAYTNNKAAVFEAWLISLVERESALRYQHTLTNALLNMDSSHMLLQNLPFAKNLHTNAYTVTISELRERRISLISSILGNMRTAVQTADKRSSTESQTLKQEYSHAIKQLMSGMKRMYEETQHGSVLRGAYINFVQRVVELLQQYAADFVMVDKFFTDSATFPLPATDPTYVVGKLKSYCTCLSDEGAQKKLTIFLQGICERAAAEDQQSYLVGQLSKSVEGQYESAESQRVSLRILLLEALFPCYTEQVFSPCGWILAVPILESSRLIFDGLFHSFDTKDNRTVEAIRRATTFFLRPIHDVIIQISNDMTLLTQPHIMLTVKSMYKAAISVLPIVEFLDRSAESTSLSASYFLTLQAFAMHITNTWDGDPLQMDLQTILPSDMTSPFHSIIDFCKKELEDGLRMHWVKHGDEYYVLRGNVRRAISLGLGTPENELEDLVACLAQFQDEMQRMPDFWER